MFAKSEKEKMLDEIAIYEKSITERKIQFEELNSIVLCQER
jgi:hypothetical protein